MTLSEEMSGDEDEDMAMKNPKVNDWVKYTGKKYKKLWGKSKM